MGFWAAMLAWGQRKTIINKCKSSYTYDGAPYDFILTASGMRSKTTGGL